MKKTCMQIFLAVSRAAIWRSTLASPQHLARKLYMSIPSMISFIAELCPLERATAQRRSKAAGPLIFGFYLRLVSLLSSPSLIKASHVVEQNAYSTTWKRGIVYRGAREDGRCAWRSPAPPPSYPLGVVMTRQKWRKTHGQHQIFNDNIGPATDFLVEVRTPSKSKSAVIVKHKILDFQRMHHKNGTW